MKLTTMALAAALLLGGSVLWAQEPDHVQGACTLAGTWYGGSSDAKYLLSITRDPGGDFTMVGYASFTQETLGYPITTAFSNSILKNRRKGYEGYGIGMVNNTTAFPAPSPEVWAAHYTVRFLDCNTIELDYDFFGAYLWASNKTPFIDPPDYVVVPPPFSETYRRMPTVCPQCPQ
jgi:hypothetical protein